MEDLKMNFWDMFFLVGAAIFLILPIVLKFGFKLAKLFKKPYIEPIFDRGLTINEWQNRVRIFNWERFGSVCTQEKLQRAMLLIHEEITECYDERTEGEEYQPWAFREELADIAIRILDFCSRAYINLAKAIVAYHSYKEQYNKLTMNRYYEHIDISMSHTPSDPSTELINSLHHQLSRFGHDWRKTGIMNAVFLVEMFSTVFEIAWLASADLEQEMINKMHFNKDRPYTKGKGFDGKYW
jgi:hypothetical protein